MKCEGDCKSHHGDVVEVEIYYSPHDVDWGRFYYCETAIKADIAAGFTVKVIESDGPAAKPLCSRPR